MVDTTGLYGAGGFGKTTRPQGLFAYDVHEGSGLVV